MNKIIKKAAQIVGGQTALAEAISVSQPRVWNWINRDNKVPIEFVIPICEAAGYAVKPHQIRSDYFKQDYTPSP